MTFALIGSAGYVAPRHLAAIRSVGGELVAALDPHDSVGVLDSYFPNTAFFTEFERFDRHLEKLKRMGRAVDYLVVCSPNYLHDAHCRFGLRHGARVICEKPLVLNARNVDALAEIERETGRRINTILQLRLHPSVRALRRKIAALPDTAAREVQLTYIASRGNWYHASWKGNAAKSGGIATNIGIHFFDLLLWLFGPVKGQEVHQRTHDRAAGFLELEGASVKWFLSINAATLPAAVQAAGGRTYRSLTIDGEEFEFSGGFEELHNLSYAEIMAGRGFGPSDVRPATALVETIRGQDLVAGGANRHPLTDLPTEPHPFGEGREG